MEPEDSELVEDQLHGPAGEFVSQPPILVDFLLGPGFLLLNGHFSMPNLLHALRIAESEIESVVATSHRGIP